MSSADWRTLAEYLGGGCGILLIVLFFLSRRIRSLNNSLADREFQNRSLSTTYGRITEQCLTVRKLNLTEKGIPLV